MFISSLFKPIVKSKSSSTIVVQFGMLFEIITKKVKVQALFDHKTVISSLSKLNIESKISFTKVACFGMLLQNMAYKVKV